MKQEYRDYWHVKGRSRGFGDHQELAPQDHQAEHSSVLPPPRPVYSEARACPGGGRGGGVNTLLVPEATEADQLQNSLILEKSAEFEWKRFSGRYEKKNE